MGCSGEKNISVDETGGKKRATRSTTFNLDSRLNISNDSITSDINMDYNKIINFVFRKHNKFRRKHNSHELKINDDLNEEAQNYAKKLLSNDDKNYFYKNFYKDSFIGENIMLSEMDSVEAINEWYSEIQFYDFNQNTFQKNAAHFTQLIWKETKEIGIGFCKNDKKYCLVVLYYPAGNVFGEFSKNVENVK